MSAEHAARLETQYEEGMPPPPPVELLASEVHALRERVAQLERRRRRWPLGIVAALAVVGLGSRVSFAYGSACGETLPGLLTPFCPDEPANAMAVNQNYRELIRLVETKVGTVSIDAGVTPGAAGTGSISTSALTAASATITGLSAATANIQSLNPTSETGFVLSCGEASFLGSLQGNPFCCRLNVASGETLCTVSTNAGGTAWPATTFGYPGLGATTTGRYSLSCVAGAPGANFPFCCRLNVNTGATTCGQGNTYSLGSAGQATVF